MSELTITVEETAPDAGFTSSVPAHALGDTGFSGSVPAQVFDAGAVTVTTAVKTAYAYCARAARRLTHFITVKALAFTAVIESRVRAFLENVFPKTGADILRQSAILNI